MILEALSSHVLLPKFWCKQVRLEIVLILTQDRCMVCAEHTIGSEIILDAPDDVGQVESRFDLLGASVGAR